MKKVRHTSLRQRHEYHEIVIAAASNGFRVSGEAADYKNQKSRFRLYRNDEAKHPCCSRKCRDRSSKAADKIKAGQCCKFLSRERSRAKRRKPWAEVVKAAATRPVPLRLLSRESDYKNNRSLLRVACKVCNKKFKQCYGQIKRSDSRRSGCPRCGRGVAETYALCIAEYLLDIEFQTQISPEFLKRWNPVRGSLRADGFAQARIAGKMLTIVLEHQGPQHKKKNHFHNSRSGDPESAYKKLVEADRYKEEVCIGVRRLVRVRDLTTVRKPHEAVDVVAKAIKKAIPEIDAHVLDIRAAKLVANDCKPLMRRLARFARFHSTLRRCAIEAKRFRFKWIRYDPLTRQIRTQCRNPNHGPSAWRPLNHGVTDCKHCFHERLATYQRLPEKDVIAAARKKQWEPLWPAGSYKNQYGKLTWKCARCGRKINDSYLHVKERSCTQCNKRENLFAEVRGQLDARGDTLVTKPYDMPLSERGNVKARCTRDGGCNRSFHQRCEKILLGKLHGCDKGKRAWQTRKAAQKKLQRRGQLGSGFEPVLADHGAAHLQHPAPPI